MSEHIKIILFAESNVCVTRLEGERVRKLIFSKLEEGGAEGNVEITFEGVTYMTPSFADECFGKLAEELGRDDFRARVRFVGATSVIRSVVNTVISNRLGRTKSEVS